MGVTIRPSFLRERSTVRVVTDRSRRRESTIEKIIFGVLIFDIGLLAVAGGPVPDARAIAIFVLTAVVLTALLAAKQADKTRVPAPAFRVLFAMLVALPALQLVPLPPAWWQTLPWGMLRRDVLALVKEQQSWQPLSLVPLDTAGTVLLAFSFVALLAGLLTLRDRRFKQLLYVFGLIALVNLSIGILQAGTGGNPHVLTKADHGALLGFFANKNHAGLSIAASLALFVQIASQSPLLRSRLNLWLIVVMVIAAVCVVPTNSRAGLGLTLLVCLWVTLRFLTGGRPWVRASVAMVAIGLTVLVSLSPAFEQVYRRFGSVDQDLRWRFIEQSEPLIRSFGLSGAGGGSFSRLFIVNERLEWVKPTIVNEAHNEYLQTLIEYGVAGILLLLVLATALVWTGIVRWRRLGKGSAERRALEVGAAIMLLYALHSVIDYPLRRPASWGLFAVGCALILRVESSKKRRDEAPPEPRD